MLDREDVLRTVFLVYCMQFCKILYQPVLIGSNNTVGIFNGLGIKVTAFGFTAGRCRLCPRKIHLG